VRDAPCPRCGCVILNQTVAGVGDATIQRAPCGVLSFVERCGHQVEPMLLPEGDRWFGEVPVWGREVGARGEIRYYSREPYRRLPGGT
jgi:hypothetical protein